MELLIEKIDRYVKAQEKKEEISQSLDMIKKTDLKEIIEVVKKSEDREGTISMFKKEIQEQIRALIDGGIL